MTRMFAAAAAFAALSTHYAQAEPPCRGSVLSGTVHDSTQALIPGATLLLDNGHQVLSASDGSFSFGCIANGAHQVVARAEGFGERSLNVTLPRTAPLQLMLEPAAVTTNVEVAADDTVTQDAHTTGTSQTISGDRLQSLADDPDDLARELTQLAAAAGGSPSNVTISVDGFQGSSKLPPKSSIAYIKINPDQFSAEYREPPFEGGRVEVYTRPGAKAYHGALFMTNGSPWENARDPFSTSKAALGKQLYGFELSGPVRRSGSDFALTLEHRSIDNFAVVNAVTLDSSGNTVNTIANVPTPQRLWLGSARLDWQLDAKNTFIASYTARADHQQNVGAGGTSLAENGYDSHPYEHTLRLSNITTASANLMHEARLSLRWDGEDDLPNSTAPQVQVAGSFTGGGATYGARQLHELDVEIDDDAILTTRKHTLKFGTQFRLLDEHERLPTNFNGTYIFGGGSAPMLDSSGNPVPGQTTVITGLEQYRRAQLGLAGGTPTAFTNTAGSPQVDFAQVRDALYIQDDYKVGHGVQISVGLRYFLETAPLALNAITPRAGILWSPDAKGSWTLHAHGGLFSGNFSPDTQSAILQQDGVARISSTVYNPVYGQPLGSGAVPIHTTREFSPHITDLLWDIWNVGGTRALPAGFNLSVDYYNGRIWNFVRTVNINSPLNGQPYGPRPGAPNLNLLQTNNSGQGRANAEFFSIEQHRFKRVQFFFGGVRVDLYDDTNDDDLFQPQSAFSDVGEFAHRNGQPVWNVFGNATLNLPAKVQLSANFNGGGDSHYNITTGFDNNGDGNFNDRPQYAAPGTPSSIQTPYGNLIASGGTAVFPRNRGVMPWTIYLDSNLQRAFTITRNPKAEHQQIITVNLRSSNILNHTNVTAVGGVLGSPLFGVPYTADNGRRVEFGLRYSF